MRTLACLAFALLALICAVAAQQPPALGDHEFPSISVADLSSINFPADARVVERNYTVFNPVPSVVRAIGYRVAAASNGNTAAGVAVNVITGALTTLGEPSISLAYFGAKAGIAINPTDSNAALGFTAAAIAFTARFMAIAEFEDLNGNGEIDYATELIGGYDLGAANFVPIQFGLDKSGAAPYYYAQTETLDGVFALRVIGCGRLAAITEGTTTLNSNPTTLKVSLSIRYFNNSLNVPRVGLTRGPSTNPRAQLALVAGFGVIAAKAAAGLAVRNFTAAQKDFNGNALNNIAVSTDAAAFTGGFSWVNLAEARDVAGNIIAGGAAVKSAVFDNLPGNSSYANKVSAGAFASFKYAKLGVYSFGAIRPVSLVWDPSASTVDTAASASVALVPALAALILAVLMLAL